MREATKQDLPKGAEAQCVLCWRIFSSDSACEMHKPYRKPLSATCKEPPDIGLQAYEKRGLVIWSTGPKREGPSQAVRELRWSKHE